MVTRRVRVAARWLLAVLYFGAGVLHLLQPAPFASIVPAWVPRPDMVVWLTGIAEIAGALALAQPWSVPFRKAAGISLATYALCVWPANFQHMALDLARPGSGLGLAYHLPRLAAQPLLIWLALWTASVTGWPFRRRRREPPPFR